jgi:hypothetical protein
VSVAQVDHSALLRLSGHPVLLCGSSIAPAKSPIARCCLPAGPNGIVDLRPLRGDMRRQSIAYSNDDASWSLNEYLKLRVPFATGE